MTNYFRHPLNGVMSWRGVAIGLVLLGGGFLLFNKELAELTAKEDTKAGLPADLQRIPADVEGFFCFRVADIWNIAVVKEARGKMAKEMPDLVKTFETEFGSRPEEIERLSSILAKHDGPIFCIGAVKPLDKEKVLTRVLVKAQQQNSAEGHAYWTSAVNFNAVAFLSNQAYVVGSAEFINRFIDRPAPKEAGALTDAVKLAAAKHLFTVGLNVAAIAQEAGNELPAQVEALRPLLRANLGTATVDWNDTIKLTARMRFANDTEASEGEKAAQAGLDLLKSIIPFGIAMAAKEPGLKQLTDTFKQLEAEFKKSKLEREGNALQLVVTAKGDTLVSGALLESVLKAREAAARAQSQNNLKQIALAMHNYHDQMGQLPPRAVFDKDGKPLLSWRVLILPYIEQDNLYKQFHLDEPWDSEHNKKWLAVIPRTYVHPKAKAGTTETHYLGFMGKEAFFDPTSVRGRRLPADFPDGTSNTIMIVEAAQGVPWSKPEDLEYDANKPLPKLGGFFPGGYNVGLCDGSVRFINNKISETTLRAAITRAGGEVLGSDW